MDRKDIEDQNEFDALVRQHVGAFNRKNPNEGLTTLSYIFISMLVASLLVSFSFPAEEIAIDVPLAFEQVESALLSDLPPTVSPTNSYRYTASPTIAATDIPSVGLTGEPTQAPTLTPTTALRENPIRRTQTENFRNGNALMINVHIT